jgi:cytochrome c peroxidase
MKAFITIIVASALLSCKKEETTLQATFLDLPSEPPVYFVETNNHIPQLGRVLFYDKALSVNSSVSCASCHKQAVGFADQTAFSQGFDNTPTTRNSMPIQNLDGFGFDLFRFGITGDNRFFPGFGQLLFWDGREQELNKMVLRPILNHIEMGTTDIEELAAKLNTLPYYRPLFKKAFDSEQITPERISDALSSFIRSIRSNNTKFDKAQVDKAQLSAQELNGKSLFFEKYDCNSCHQVQTPTGYALFGGGFANIGLDQEYKDNGLSLTTGQPSDAGKFKIPSLRNVLLTAPYMHDGRFATLEEVMEHYSENMSDHPNLDIRLKDGSGHAQKMNISPSEKQALIAFLNSLTDFQAVTDLKFASPFKNQ